MDELNVSSGPTYIDNGDGTCRVEYPRAEAGWYSGYDVLPPSPPLTPWQSIRARVGDAWFDARCWLAEKVLRVPLGDDR